MFRNFSVLILVFSLATTCHAEDDIWPRALGFATSFNLPNVIIVPGNPGPVEPMRDYVLARVEISPSLCNQTQPGTIDGLTAVFFDDASDETNFPQPGTARLSFFATDGSLPDDILDNPDDDGIDIPVIYDRATFNGIPVIEVIASGLEDLNLEICVLDPDPEKLTTYFVGLTPIFSSDNVLFSGQQIATTTSVDVEGPSIQGQTSPGRLDWTEAADPDGNSLFAVLEVRGRTTPDVYLSFRGLGEPAAATDTVLNANPTDVETIYVWVDDRLQVRDGFDLDLSFTTSGVAEFIRAESLQADITVMGSIVGERWDFFGPAKSVTADAVSGLLAVASTSVGIATENTGISPFFLMDELYDPVNGAFLVAEIDFVVVETGETDVQFDSALIVDEGVEVGENFGTVRIRSGLLGPEDTGPIVGDINGDGDVNLLDVEPFVSLLSNGGFCISGDINNDGAVNLLDVEPFIDLIGE